LAETFAEGNPLCHLKQTNRSSETKADITFFRSPEVISNLLLGSFSGKERWFLERWTERSEGMQSKNEMEQKLVLPWNKSEKLFWFYRASPFDISKAQSGSRLLHFPKIRHWLPTHCTFIFPTTKLFLHGFLSGF
jgi:hypothetical protein